MAEQEEEHFDVLTKTGHKAGFTKPRGAVHRDGDYHRAVHVWIYAESTQELLLQRRADCKDSWPGLWDISSAGHISAGDSSLNTARRELNEELGVVLPKDAFESIFIFLEESVTNGGTFINNEYCDVYLVTTLEPIPLEAFTLQESEVSAVKYISFEEYRSKLVNKDPQYVPYDVDGQYGQLFKILVRRTPLQEETYRMKKARHGKDPRGKSDVPSFLRPHVATTDEPGGSKSHAFQPTWGFRKQDSVVGSTQHSMDWSLHSITPRDYIDIVTGSNLESIETFGCQALAVANANFQGVLHQAKSWQKSSRTFEASLEKMKTDYISQKQMMAEKEEQLAAAHAELVALRAKKEEIIDDYMDGQEFKELMERHDETLFPCQFTQGWNEALDSVVKAHPGMFLPKNFPSPHPPAFVAVAGDTSQSSESDDEMDDVGDNRILDPIHHSPPARTS